MMLLPIKAKVVEEITQVELPLNGNLKYVDRFLARKGFKFVKDKRVFETCDGKSSSTLRMKSTSRRSVIITLHGDNNTVEDLQRAVYPMPLEYSLYLEGDEGKDSDNTIRMLLKNGFEIVGLSPHGNVQIFKKKESLVKLIYPGNGKFHLAFNGLNGKLSKRLLSGFSLVS